MNYGLAVLSVAATLLVQLVLDPFWRSAEMRYLVLLVPVTISTWIGGRGPGLVATVLAAIAADYTLIDGSMDLSPSVLHNNIALLLFLTEGVAISLLAGMLQQSESRNIAIMRSAIDGVITVDLQGQIVDFSTAAEYLFGYRRAEVLGRKLTELIVPRDVRERERADLWRELSTGQNRVVGPRIEMTGLQANGTEFPVELSMTRLPQDGPPLLAGFVRDIRPQMQLEHQLKRQMQIARLLQQANTLSSTTRSFENVLQNCLDMVCEITGWPVGHIYLPDEKQRELVASGIWHLDDPGTPATMWRATRSQRLRRGEGLPGRIWDSGEPEWMANVNPGNTVPGDPQSSDPSIQGAFGFPVKINQEVVAVMEFFTSEEMPPDAEMLALLGSVGEQLGQVIQRRRREEQLRKAKDAAEAANRAKSEFLANVSHEVRTPMNAVLGMLQVVLGEELPPVVRDNLKTAADSAKTLMSLLNDLLDFSRMEAGRFQLEAAPFNLRDGITAGLKTLSLKAQEKRLQLTCSIDADVPDQLIGDVRRLRQVLLNLTGNAIKFTEQGEVAVSVALIKPDEADLNDNPSAPSEPTDSWQNRTTNSTSEGTLDHDQLRQRIVWRESTLVRRDPDESESPKSSVIVPRSNGESHHDTDVTLHLILMDTGIGISPDDQSRIFEPFTQVDSSSTRRHTGTGLGLTICCELARRMGGVMWVESELGKGSRFHCTARFGVQPKQKSIAAPAEPSHADAFASLTTRPLRVLLAEDTPANQKVVSAILAKRGHQVEIAHDGRETIDMVRNHKFDVVLMDVQMPHIDGYQATRAIRRLDEAGQARIPIVAMTAHAMSGDREQCLAAGMDDYVPKPIDAMELIHTIERLVVERTAQ